MTVVESVEPPYRDASRARDERVEDLLRRMTLEEKAAQLGSAWVFQLAKGVEVSESGAELLRNGLGQVTRISGASSLDAEGAARLANAIQRHLVEETRLGIPAIVHEEICSGLMAREAVVFPQAIGLASTWEPDLAEELADAIRVQMRAVGAHQGLAPVLDVCRDPRWGRTEETFGEDPYLVSRFGVAFTRGLQGPSLRSGVVATLKHFVGYGASDGGMNWAPAGIPPRALREVYLHPFEAAVRVAGARSVMNAYNEIDGILCAADRDLLTGTLRDEWGFEGFVVSDYFSIRQLADVPPAGGGRGERRGAGARGWSRRRAAGHRLLRRARCCARSRRGSSPRRRSTRRCGGCCARSSTSASSTSRTSTSPPRPAPQPRRPTASLRGRSPGRASCC